MDGEHGTNRSVETACHAVANSDADNEIPFSDADRSISPGDDYDFCEVKSRRIASTIDAGENLFTPASLRVLVPSAMGGI